MLKTEIGEVPVDWRIAPLQEFVDRVTYGFTNPMPTSEQGPYMITAKDIQDGRIRYETARRTTEEAFHKLLTAKSRPKKGDLLLTKDGTLGRLAIVGQNELCINQSVALIRPKKDICVKFLYYLLSAPYCQNRMIADADGTTIKHIYITRVGKMKVAMPPRKEREAIAAVLGALDDKIELNRRMNETLEDMARTIFKSWFVDFDPVRAKSEGKKPFGMDDPTAALFPDRFAPDGFPQGWHICSHSRLSQTFSLEVSPRLTSTMAALP